MRTNNNTIKIHVCEKEFKLTISKLPQKCLIQLIVDNNNFSKSDFIFDNNITIFENLIYPALCNKNISFSNYVNAITLSGKKESKNLLVNFKIDDIIIFSKKVENEFLYFGLPNPFCYDTTNHNHTEFITNYNLLLKDYANINHIINTEMIHQNIATDSTIIFPLIFQEKILDFNVIEYIKNRFANYNFETKKFAFTVSRDWQYCSCNKWVPGYNFDTIKKFRDDNDIDYDSDDNDFYDFAYNDFVDRYGFFTQEELNMYKTIKTSPNMKISLLPGYDNWDEEHKDDDLQHEELFLDVIILRPLK